MKIIKLNAIDSTNTYLKNLSATELVDDFTVVQAVKQTKGRGQMGTSWQSESCKNLTISVFKDVSTLEFEEQYFISMVAALAVSKTLKILKLPKVKIKWPNDILSESLKISGILIENIVKNNELRSAIIGIGINVNQKYFDNLPQATSIHLITGKLFDVDEVVDTLLAHLAVYFKRLDLRELAALKSEYEHQLFRIHKPSTFLLNNGQHLTGYINGSDLKGHLEILTEDAILRTYGLKEIRLLY